MPALVMLALVVPEWVVPAALVLPAKASPL